MFHSRYYLLVTLVFLLLAISERSSYFIIAWVWGAVSFFCVSLAYMLNRPTIFHKRSDGRIPYFIRWVFWPFFFSVQLFNSWARSVDPVPSIQEVEKGLFLARRLFPSDIHELKEKKVTAILDVTAEFSSLDWAFSYQGCDYLNIPVLDHSSPSSAQLYKALNWIHTHRKNGNSVVIHCALGRGRSVFMMAAYLLSQHPELTPEQVIQKIQKIRSTVNLNSYQRKALIQFYQDQELVVKNSAWLIANPASGRRQWEKEKGQILAFLEEYYEITLKETTPEQNGKALAKLAVNASPDLVIACGGDGTVAEVASELVNSPIKLGIIPFGTANALSHVLYGPFSKIASTESACINLIEGCEKRVDTATCNGELMLLMVGVGFEQKMIEKADRAKKNTFGQMAYLKAFKEAVSQNEANEYKMELDGELECIIRTPSLTVANAAPMTSLLAQGNGEPDMLDGRLDVTWLDADRMQVMNLLELTLLGLGDRHLEKADEEEDISGVYHRQARRVKLDISAVHHYVIDGETRQGDWLDISINPKSLSVIVPESALIRSPNETE